MNTSALEEVRLAVRVLIVDDQEPFRVAARLVVEATDGFEVLAEAESGEEAVELARSLAPDLILMDVNLPGMDGLAATQRILAEQPHTVVVVLSTYEEDEYAPRAIESGARSYISKSAFSPERLSQAWHLSAAS